MSAAGTGGSRDAERATSIPWLLPESSDLLVHDVDVVIVGAGLAGLLAAAFIAPDARVVVLEDSPVVGGSAARHTGLAFQGLLEHPFRLEHSLGLDGATELYRFCAASLDSLAEVVPIVRDGIAWCAVDEREPGDVTSSVATLHRLGVGVRAVDGARGSELTGTRDIGPGFVVEADGVVEPAVGIEAALGAARAAGASVCLGRPVHRVVDTDAGISVLGPGFEVRTEIVVFANNARAPQVEPWFNGKIVPFREQAARFSAPSCDAPLPIPVRAGFGWTTARREPEAWIVHGCRWATQHLEVGESDDSVVRVAVHERIAAFAKRFLGATDVTHRWSWISAGTCDGLPIIGPIPGQPRLVALSGFVGNPWGLCAGAARAVADGLQHGSSELPRFLSSYRFV